MKSAVGSLTGIIAVIVFILGSLGSANAQRPNERQVRDLVRSLSSQVDNLQYTVEDEMRRSSASQQDIDDLSASLTDLQGKLSTFEDNVGQKRENRDDANDIVTSAQNVDAFF